MKHSRQPALLVLIVTAIVAIGLGGTTLSPFQETSGEDSDLAEAAATTAPETQVPDVLQASTIEPTATLAPTLPPTEVPPTPTQEPVETPRPVAPENPYDQSYILERGESGRREVALTFDAGEGAGYTAEILDLLDAYDIKGSFGVTGEWARANPDLILRIVDEGHMIINHTESHKSWTGASSGGEPLSEAERIEQLEGVENAVYDISGYTTKPYFRPPYGDYDLEALQLLKREGYEYTLWWTCDSLAWSGLQPDEIEERCGPDSEYGGPGGIILMHVAQENDYLALEALITSYDAAGYDFVTMEQMIQP